MPISPLHDAETIRQQKNLTNSQKRTNSQTREGVLVNSFIKDNSEADKINLNETMDTLVISKNTKLPEKLYEKDNKSKGLLPISAIALSVMGAVAGVSSLVNYSSKVNLTMDSLKRVPPTVRNVAINDETIQALYRIVECPNYKTIQAGTGVFALTAMAFMGKTFFDGLKEVWVKKREADIQKNLQEKLIDIETQSFGGKMQITRNMLSKRAVELSKYLNRTPQHKTHHETFKALMFQGRNERNENNKRDNKLIFALTGLATFAGIVGLGFLSLKNLTKSKAHLEQFVKDTKKEISNVVKKSTPETKKQDMINLENLFKTVEATPEEMVETLKPLNWEDKEEFISRLSKDISKSTVDANIYCGGGKTPKPTFYSHVNDYRAFLYNYLLDTDNKQFKALFFGTTGLTALGYGGKLLGDAIKEVQVKKINADTEAQLQQRLVSTELKNFKSKKDVAIQPLMDEFYRQASEGKPKEELKVIADNILLEIKNGPPFVYS